MWESILCNFPFFTLITSYIRISMQSKGQQSKAKMQVLLKMLIDQNVKPSVVVINMVDSPKQRIL